MIFATDAYAVGDRNPSAAAAQEAGAAVVADVDDDWPLPWTSWLKPTLTGRA